MSTVYQRACYSCSVFIPSSVHCRPFYHSRGLLYRMTGWGMCINFVTQRLHGLGKRIAHKGLGAREWLIATSTEKEWVFKDIRDAHTRALIIVVVLIMFLLFCCPEPLSCHAAVPYSPYQSVPRISEKAVTSWVQAPIWTGIADNLLNIAVNLYSNILSLCVLRVVVWNTSFMFFRCLGSVSSSMLLLYHLRWLMLKYPILIYFILLFCNEIELEQTCLFRLFEVLFTFFQSFLLSWTMWASLSPRAIGNCLWQWINTSLSLSLPPPPGGDSLALVSFWGEAMVSVTVQIITIAGGALSDPGALSLWAPPVLSLSAFLLSMCLSICHVGEGALGLLHAASATHHATLTLCNAFMPTNPSLEVMMAVTVRRDSPFGAYSWTGATCISVRSLAQGWRVPAVGEGQADNPALGSSDGMRWAQWWQGQHVPVSEAHPAHGEEWLYTLRGWPKPIGELVCVPATPHSGC